MYLSKITLDLLDKGNMKTLADIYQTHQLVMSGFKAFDMSVSRILYRVEHEIKNGGATASILVQSALKPAWPGQERGTLHTQTKEFTMNVAVGRRYRFRLEANPIITKDGRRYGLIRDEAFYNWLKRKEGSIGAAFTSFVAIDKGYFTGKKEKERVAHKVSIKKVCFEGVLDVIDQEKLRAAISGGIGPAKAFGCGLLSLKKLP